VTSAPSTVRRVVAIHGSSRSRRDDHVVTEEPLEIRVNGEPYAITMRTPGDDEALALGFLLSERLIDGAGDIASVAHHPADPALANRLNVVLTDAASSRAGRRLDTRRRTLMTSACGLCGRLTIDTLAADADPVAAEWTLPAGALARLPDALRTQQAVFESTGGLHAAGLFASDGTTVDLAEDIGRHNAVDKVTGRALVAGRLPLSTQVLVVSGRASFEIVQKAWLAGVPVVAAISAPSSLAIELADHAGITLAGFVRGQTLNVYTHASRVT
jgi:FdhD protein